MQKIKQLIERTKQYLPPDKVALIQNAYEFSAKALEGQLHLSGEAYIEHSLQIALTLSELQLDASSLVAALLYDVPEGSKVDELAYLWREVCKLACRRQEA